MTDPHIARIAVRNQQIVAVAHYYGVSIATCEPADSESKGGSESTVKQAKRLSRLFPLVRLVQLFPLVS